MSQLPVPTYSPDAEHRFFVFDAMDGDHYYFASAAERDQYAAHLIDNYMDDGWDESVEQVVAGELTHVVQQTNRVERPSAAQIDAEGYDAEGRHWLEGWTHYCDYELQPLASPAAEVAGEDEVLAGLARAGSAAQALDAYQQGLVRQDRALVAGGIDVNTCRRLRARWDEALLQRLQALQAVPA